MNSQLNGSTKTLGLIGWPVEHSQSPAMHTAAARAAGLNIVYIPLPVHPNAVGAAVRGLPALGFAGANVTVPHKQAVIPYIDQLDPVAHALGAVNTIVIEQTFDGYRPILRGFNTDAPGFTADLKGFGVEVSRRPCLVLGAGGSARAAVYALAQAGAQVHVIARRLEQRLGVVEQLTAHIPRGVLQDHDFSRIPDLVERFPDAVIVNTTPLGMAPETQRSIWHEEWPFPPRGFVYDLIYTPAETRLMRQASAAGVPAVNGLGMLLHQGAEAFYLWTGVRPDLEVMRNAAEKK